MFYPDMIYGLILFINGGLAFIVSLFIIARGVENLQNTFMGLSLGGFSVYLSFEAFIYILQSQNMLLVNVLRDISLIGVMIASFMLIMGGIFIYKGRTYFEDHINLFVGFGTIHAIATVITLIFESISFTGTNPTVMEFQGNELSIFLSHIYPVVLILIGLVFFYFVYQESKQHDKIVGRKILTLILGVLAVVFGAIWMTTIRTIFFEQIAPPLIYLPGHLLYFLSSIILFWAFRR